MQRIIADMGLSASDLQDKRVLEKITDALIIDLEEIFDYLMIEGMIEKLTGLNVSLITEYGYYGPPNTYDYDYNYTYYDDYGTTEYSYDYNYTYYDESYYDKDYNYTYYYSEYSSYDYMNYTYYGYDDVDGDGDVDYDDYSATLFNGTTYDSDFVYYAPPLFRLVCSQGYVIPVEDIDLLDSLIDLDTIMDEIADDKGD
jgi:hypothetical protein